MFKGILPSKRVPSSDFTVLTQLADNIPQGKENMPHPPQTIHPVGKPPKSGLTLGKKKKSTIESKKQKEQQQQQQQQPVESPNTEEAFHKLLDELQIPPNLRPKLLGMDSGVKAAMLRTSHVITEKLGPTPTIVGTPPRAASLRRVHSTESLGSPRAPFMRDVDAFEPPRTAGVPGHVSAHQSPYNTGRSNSPRQGTGHWRGSSVDVGRFFSKSTVNLGAMSSLDLVSAGKAKEKGSSAKNVSPMRFCSILQGQSSLQIDVEDIKKLRLMLRNESASWTEEFCRVGGYSALLTRLNEVLEVEWREEQHDDQVLHELLRCFKALSTSSIGCSALRSSCPTPYTQLMSLIYSDKKPGDVATRQLILDLLLILFELYPANSLPANSRNGRSNRDPWESQTSLAANNAITLPTPHRTLFEFIRSLLLTPAPAAAEAPDVPLSPHEFIESLHIPRIYKTYLQEMSDVCRDYFWVFCHPNNTIWVLAETDETRVEKPKAPSGMTGGVEFEAMCYFTTHLRFINAISACVAELKKPKEHELSAYRFHHDLFLSGLERIILISRKASTTYYPTLHLELARYVDHVTRAGYELPYTVSRLIGMPPPALSKPLPQTPAPAPASSQSQSHSHSHSRQVSTSTALNMPPPLPTRGLPNRSVPTTPTRPGMPGRQSSLFGQGQPQVPLPPGAAPPKLDPPRRPVSRMN